MNGMEWNEIFLKHPSASKIEFIYCPFPKMLWKIIAFTLEMCLPTSFQLLLFQAGAECFPSRFFYCTRLLSWNMCWPNDILAINKANIHMNMLLENVKNPKVWFY